MTLSKIKDLCKENAKIDYLQNGNFIVILKNELVN
jgi:hypothetical protein